MSSLRHLMSKALNGTRVASGIIRSKIWNIKNQWDGDRIDSQGKKHVVFVHFDQVGQVHDYVIKMLESFRECDFEITFVTNSPKLPAESLDVLKPFCRKIIHRYNSGYDFAAYRDGIKSLPMIDDCESLILVNDSVYGPLFSLKKALSKVDPKQVDVWGITDSWEHNYHVQAYFMLFFNKAIISKSFKKFWANYPNVSNKWWVIFNGELKLTKKLAQEKMRISVQCPYWQVTEGMLEPVRSHLSSKKIKQFSPIQNKFLKNVEDQIVSGNPVNQSHMFWETTIRDWDCLFLKRELIQKNPLAVPYVWRWQQVIDECTDYDSKLIEQHLHSL